MRLFNRFRKWTSYVQFIKTEKKMFKFHHTAISARNLETTIEFYQLFGFEKKYFWEAEDKSLKIVHMKLNNVFLEIFNYSDFIDPRHLKDSLGRDLQKIGVKHFALVVDNLEAAQKFVIKNGIAENVEIKIGRTEVRYFFIKDPNDVFVEILEDKRKL